jgi:hypothetical protein
LRHERYGLKVWAAQGAIGRLAGDEFEPQVLPRLKRFLARLAGLAWVPGLSLNPLSSEPVARQLVSSQSVKVHRLKGAKELTAVRTKQRSKKQPS